MLRSETRADAARSEEADRNGRETERRRREDERRERETEADAELVREVLRRAKRAKRATARQIREQLKLSGTRTTAAVQRLLGEGVIQTTKIRVRSGTEEHVVEAYEIVDGMLPFNVEG
jgi:hypothetical protein